MVWCYGVMAVVVWCVIGVLCGFIFKKYINDWFLDELLGSNIYHQQQQQLVPLICSSSLGCRIRSDDGSFLQCNPVEQPWNTHPSRQKVSDQLRKTCKIWSRGRTVNFFASRWSATKMGLRACFPPFGVGSEYCRGKGKMKLNRLRTCRKIQGHRHLLQGFVAAVWTKDLKEEADKKGAFVAVVVCGK
ncbi:hypothetical protein E2C01_011752 [Portunus trituberculatus]|uniref:Uncharacterized protein n=1 Tax=Portunus trituberculatus TaxID=210409 RepID=A0A5B7DBY2_PORTR|nr:hypothetical protein [Portunus trituberculatus]